MLLVIEEVGVLVTVAEEDDEEVEVEVEVTVDVTDGEIPFDIDEVGVIVFDEVSLGVID